MGLGLGYAHKAHVPPFELIDRCGREPRLQSSHPQLPIVPRAPPPGAVALPRACEGVCLARGDLVRGRARVRVRVRVRVRIKLRVRVRVRVRVR